MKLVTKSKMLERLDRQKSYDLQKEAFLAHAEGRVVQPPVAHLELLKGSLHIKYGMLLDDSIFVAKLATGFSSNKNLKLELLKT